MRGDKWERRRGGRVRLEHRRRGLPFWARTAKLLDEQARRAISLIMGMPHNAIALPADLERRVRELAAGVGDSPGRIMIQAIEEYVADMEDGRIAQARLKALDAGESDTVSLEQLLAEYDMAN